jgi:hypothetical protein
MRLIAWIEDTTMKAGIKATVIIFVVGLLIGIYLGTLL